MRSTSSLALAASLLLAPAGAASASPCAVGELVLPGTTTCLRLGVVVRAEAAASRGAAPIVPTAPDGGRPRTASTLRGGARADLDARAPTAAGPLRAYLSVGTDGFARR